MLIQQLIYISVCTPPIDTTNIQTFPPCYKRRMTTRTQCGQETDAPPLRHRKLQSLQWTTIAIKGACMKNIFLFTPGQYKSTGCLHNPKLYKQIILATSLQQVLVYVQQKRKKRFNMPYQIQELPEIFWYKELP